MNELIEAALWFTMIVGVFALLGLMAEGAEWFADALDSWAESISSNYVDE